MLYYIKSVWNFINSQTKIFSQLVRKHSLA